jgi:hypothetical protein
MINQCFISEAKYFRNFPSFITCSNFNFLQDTWLTSVDTVIVVVNIFVVRRSPNRADYYCSVLGNTIMLYITFSRQNTILIKGLCQRLRGLWPWNLYNFTGSYIYTTLFIALIPGALFWRASPPVKRATANTHHCDFTTNAMTVMSSMLWRYDVNALSLLEY